MKERIKLFERRIPVMEGEFMHNAENTFTKVSVETIG